MPKQRSVEQVIAAITDAFRPNKYPGDWCLKRSTEGDEPYLLEKEFTGKTSWESLDVQFIDQAPDGFASALSFFSDEAFRFYLPAYLIAQLRDELESSDPDFHLSHGLSNQSRNTLINPRRYGGRSWWQATTARFAMFSREEVQAIVQFLEFRLRRLDADAPYIEEALDNYWRERCSSALTRKELAAATDS